MRCEETTVVSKTDVLSMLRAHDAPLYAVLDAARDPEVSRLLREGGEEYRSLLDGRRGDNLAKVAPYLVRLPSEARLLERIVEEGWGKSWGFFSTSAQPFDELRRHLRSLLVAETPKARALYLRFYDPRVLRPLLASLEDEHLTRVFGPVRAMYVEGRTSLKLLWFQPARAVPRRSYRGPLTLSEEVMTTLSRGVLEAFVDRMVAFLREKHAGDAARWSDDELCKAVHEVVERAERRGLAAERKVCRLVVEAICGGEEARSSP